MKKTYIAPETNTVRILLNAHLLEASQQGGVGTGGSVGDEFNSGDENYSRKHSSLWDDDEE